LIDLNFPNSVAELPKVQQAAQALGLTLSVFRVRTADDIDVAFDGMTKQKIECLIVGPGNLHFTKRAQIVAAAMRSRIPTVYPFREFAVDGGLVSYGNKLQAAFRWAGLYAGRLLKGERIEELPVIQSVEFELIVNQKAAKILGLRIAPTVLALADEVIE
jgi:putative ABC transport system substrate-binding protein